jgi:hypothetical protein
MGSAKDMVTILRDDWGYALMELVILFIFIIFCWKWVVKD